MTANNILIYSLINVLFSHYLRSFLVKLMGKKVQRPTAKKICREWETFKHPTLDMIALVSCFPLSSENPTESRRVQDSEGMKSIKKKQGLLNTDGPMVIGIHRDWGSMHRTCTGLHQMGSQKLWKPYKWKLSSVQWSLWWLLSCQLDHNWNELKPKWLDMLVRDFLKSESLRWEDLPLIWATSSTGRLSKAWRRKLALCFLSLLLATPLQDSSTYWTAAETSSLLPTAKPKRKPAGENSPVVGPQAILDALL